MDSFTFAIACLLYLFGFSLQATESYSLKMTPERYLRINPDITAQINISCVLKDSAGQPVALAGCEFREYYEQRTWQFNEGPASPNYPEIAGVTFKYNGRGLENGDCGLTLEGYRHLHIFILGCRVRTATGDWQTAAMLLVVDTDSAIQYHLEPPGVVLAPAGTDVTLQGKAERELFKCWFRLPTADDTVQLHFDDGPASDNHSLARYHGAGLDKKECGITLLNVQPELSGFVRGDVYDISPGSWSYDFIEIIILAAPDDVGMTNTTTNEGGILNATCWAKNSRPVSNITWLLDGEVIRQDSTNDAPEETKWLWNHDPQSITQHLLLNVTREDNGKQLVCRVGHTALPLGEVDFSKAVTVIGVPGSTSQEMQQ